MQQQGHIRTAYLSILLGQDLLHLLLVQPNFDQKMELGVRSDQFYPNFPAINRNSKHILLLFPPWQQYSLIIIHQVFFVRLL